MAADAIEFTDKLKQKINLSIEDSLKQRAKPVISSVNGYARKPVGSVQMVRRISI